jgi:PAS domain S-box-containing protein
LLSISRDITSRVNVDDWLLESNQRLKYVVEAADMMVYEIEDDSGKVTIVRGLEELLGYSVGEVPSTVDWWINQIHPDDKSRAQEQFFPTKPVDKVVNEYRIKNRTGEYIPVQGIAKVLRDKTGKPQKIIGSMQNITDRKNLEKLLQEKERLATVGITAGMVGHDIRNPLQAIISDLYLLKDDLTTNAKCRTEGVTESLESIETNISYINKIVADLQDYARPVKIECAELSLYEFTVSVFEIVPMPDNLTPQIKMDKSMKLKSDPTLLKRILANLVSNAVQAMPKGGKLVIGASEKEGKVMLSVEDTGMGIPEEFKPKLFTPLETTKAKGQGFGLAVVKKFVDALGGDITFESKEGNGTKFIIALPKT